MPITHATIKVVRGCNLACKYCYVDYHNFGSDHFQLMSNEVLELLFKRISEYTDAQQLTNFTFYWHGGEPLLQPMSFFTRLIELSNEYCFNIKTNHLLQTNGTLITPEYAKLLKNLNINVAVSLDGLPNMNDQYRVDRFGNPTSKRILKGIEYLKEAGFPLQLLCVISPEMIVRGEEIYKYFRSMGTTWMDFLLPHANINYSTFPIENFPTPEQFSQFYISIYKAWMDEGNNGICVRRLWDYMQLILGGEGNTCIFGNSCSHIITIFPNGDIYTCDDLLSVFSKPLGSLYNNKLEDIESHPIMISLNKDSPVLFGEECKNCQYFDICRADCTNFRVDKNRTFMLKNFYCETNKMIIDFIRDDIIKRFEETGLLHKIIKIDST